MLRSVSLLLGIVCLNLICTSTISSTTDNIVPEDLIEWQTFSPIVCINPLTIYVALFKCELPVNYLEGFDEDVCYVTTTEPPPSTPESTTEPVQLTTKSTTELPQSTTESTTESMQSTTQSTTEPPSSITESTTEPVQSTTQSTTELPQSTIESTTEPVQPTTGSTTEPPSSITESTTEPVQLTTKSTTKPPQSTTQSYTGVVVIAVCPDKNSIGQYCNESFTHCAPHNPCQNNGICYPDDSEPRKYRCQCLSEDYSGDNCEKDNRICKNDTCWHDGDCISGTVTTNDSETFNCKCKLGYDGRRCELVTNMCTNITCENRGKCVSSHLTWTCWCTDPSLYSGIYCEHESTTLIVKRIITRSFASIAIAAIIGVFLFVIVMDVLKYGFKIDPVDRERQLMKSERAKKQASKGRKKEKCAKVAIRFLYQS